MKSFGYAAQSKTSALEPFHFERRELRATDVVVAIGSPRRMSAWSRAM
jgi:hypothetical protein